MLAAGPWSVTLLAAHGIDLPITVHREQILLIDPGQNLGPVPVFSDLVSLQYIRAEGSGKLLFGNSDLSVVEPANPDHYSNQASASFIDAAVDKVGTRLPGLANPSISSTYAGCYDVTPDFNPVISETPIDGLVVAAGFSGHGYKISPGRRAAGRRPRRRRQELRRRHPGRGLPPLPLHRRRPAHQPPPLRRRRPDALKGRTTMRMIIHERRDTADSVISFALGRTDGGTLPTWTPGSHVDVALDNGITRQYSLCSDPHDNRTWRIGVLREPDSRGGSKYIFDKLYAGDIVEVGEPRNHFELDLAPSYVFIAGGIGITPILPMIAAAERAGAEWTLLYGGRTRTSMAFLDDLARHGDRVTVAPQDEVGPLDLAGLFSAPLPDMLVYACGPEPLLDAISEQTVGWPAGALRIERFSPRTLERAGADDSFEVEFAISGVTATVPGYTNVAMHRPTGRLCTCNGHPRSSIRRSQ